MRAEGSLTAREILRDLPVSQDDVRFFHVLIATS